MRKAFGIVFVCFFAWLGLGLVGCQSSFDEYSKHVSELRPFVYSFADGEIVVDVVSGYREKSLALDGRTGERVDFAVVTVVPSVGVSSALELSYELAMGERRFAGKLKRHPFDENYSVEIQLWTAGAPLEVTIKGNGISKTQTLEAISDRMIGYAKAFDIAVKRLNKSISTLKKNGTLEAEIFIRLIQNPITTAGGHFWYVAFVASDQTTYAVLIDPKTEKVVAIRQ